MRTEKGPFNFMEQNTKKTKGRGNSNFKTVCDKSVFSQFFVIRLMNNTLGFRIISAFCFAFVPHQHGRPYLITHDSLCTGRSSGVGWQQQRQLLPTANKAQTNKCSFLSGFRRIRILKLTMTCPWAKTNPSCADMRWFSDHSLSSCSGVTR